MTPALIGLTALWLTGCSSTRSVTGVSDSKFQEARVERVVDSLRENISKNQNENLTEHEVITETIIRNDSVKVERFTDRVTVRDRSAKMEAKKEEVRVVRDTVYVERTDSVFVKEESPRQARGDIGRASALSYLKWIFWIIVSVTVLLIVIKMFNLFKV